MEVGGGRRWGGGGCYGWSEVCGIYGVGRDYGFGYANVGCRVVSSGLYGRWPLLSLLHFLYSSGLNLFFRSQNRSAGTCIVPGNIERYLQPPCTTPDFLASSSQIPPCKAPDHKVLILSKIARSWLLGRSRSIIGCPASLTNLNRKYTPFLRFCLSSSETIVYSPS